MKRREFIKLIAASTGAAFAASCGAKKSTEKLIPHLVPPEDGVIPGEPVFTTSTCTECPAQCGLLVKSYDKVYEERHGFYPVKLEGSPGNPINDGTLCIRGQASLTRLYHPDRLKGPLLKDSRGRLKPATWEEAYRRVVEALDQSKEAGERSFYLSGRTTGCLSRLIELFCSEMGLERPAEFEPFCLGALREANGILFRRKEVPRFRLEEADLLVSFGADLFETFINPVAFGRGFYQAKSQGQFVWYHIEPHVSLTGLQADERLAIHPGSEAHLLLFVLRTLLDEEPYRQRLSKPLREALPPVGREAVLRATGLDWKQVAGLLESLRRARRPLVVAGGVSTAQPSGLEVALLAGLLQWVVGMNHRAWDFSRRENYDRVGGLKDLEELSRRLEAEAPGVLFLSRLERAEEFLPTLGPNVKKARLTVFLTDFLSRGAREADVVLPISHALESWGDAEPRRGIHSVIQPALEPLFDTKAEGDILIGMMERAGKKPPFSSFRQYLFSCWARDYGQEEIDEFLKRGYVEKEVSVEEVHLDEGSLLENLKALSLPRPMARPVLVVAPSIRSFDGRSRLLPLLEEIPDPLSTITYGQWLLVSPSTARKMGLQDGDEVLVSSSNWLFRMPVKLQEGLREDVWTVQIDMVSVPLFKAEPKTGEMLAYVEAIKVERTGSRVRLPIMAGSLALVGRGIVPWPVHRKEREDHGPETLYPEHEHKDYRWAMAIDLELCTGCSACVAACYIENNVPVVGRQEHLIGREMSWIRIEQHRDARGRLNFLPMLCQHCENAPCEPVCPVFAAYHNPQGLNAQIYNRCVGTRYCSNNCPYKVRRFNWFDHDWPSPLDKMLNPELLVRSRGVMEKCTFCIQRIRAAGDRAKDEGRKIRDGEVVPACAQTCPSGAIVFGSILDEESRVWKKAHSERSYRVFEELGTESAVYYLARREPKGGR